MLKPTRDARYVVNVKYVLKENKSLKKNLKKKENKSLTEAHNFISQTQGTGKGREQLGG